MPWSPRIVDELAAQNERVTVVTWELGDYTPPPNVSVYVIPQRFWGIPRRLGGPLLLNLWVANIIWRHPVDVCFIHMAMPFAYLLAPVLKLYRIRTLMWYAHGAVTNQLKLANKLVDRIITSSPEGCRLQSNKIHIIGQGIDTNIFTIPTQKKTNPPLILTVARITPSKQIKLMLDVLALVKHTIPDIRLQIIGKPLTEQDAVYYEDLQQKIGQLNLKEHVIFSGYMVQQDIAAAYASAFLHLNLSNTGSMDKTVLESFACGVPALTSNEAFFYFLSEHPEFIIREKNASAIAEQIVNIYNNIEAYHPETLRNLIVGHHDHEHYLDQIQQHLNAIYDQ